MTLRSSPEPPWQCLLLANEFLLWRIVRWTYSTTQKWLVAQVKTGKGKARDMTLKGTSCLILWRKLPFPKPPAPTTFAVVSGNFVQLIFVACTPGKRLRRFLMEIAKLGRNRLRNWNKAIARQGNLCKVHYEKPAEDWHSKRGDVLQYAERVIKTARTVYR